MLLSLILISGLLSEQSLSKLTVQRKLPYPVFARTPFLTQINISNQKRLLPSFSIQVEDVINGQALSKKCYFLKVPAGAQQGTSYRLSLPRRGCYRYEAMRIGTRFPFAFFLKSRLLSSPEELIVFPHLQALNLSLPQLQGLHADLHQLLQRGEGRDFHGLRSYRSGDPARDIHWKSSARRDLLLLREYEIENSLKLTLFLNDRLPPGAPPR